jgi:cation diffusion facilitator family transporter
MMLAEIVSGSIFGSLALVADGLHMATHAGALIISALAYTYARKHVADSRFVFGTGKLGDLAGFTSAIVLAMVALLVGYEAVSRFISPVPINFGEAIPIAVVGLLVNLASVWLLGHDHHGHNHEHRCGHRHHEHAHELEHATENRDHSIRSAYFHVIADSAVSVFMIVGLLLARAFGWVWMDALAGVVGAFVIASWSWTLARDTGAILLDMNSDRRLADNVRQVIERNGDKVLDLHIWRLGPGHMSAVVSVATREALRGPSFYHTALKRFKGLSHLTVEVNPLRVAA